MTEVINPAQLEWQGPYCAAPLAVRSQIHDLALEMSLETLTPLPHITVTVWS